MKAYGLTDTVLGKDKIFFRYIEFEFKRVDGILCWEAIRYFSSCIDMPNHIYLNRRLMQLSKSPSRYIFEESDLAN